HFQPERIRLSSIQNLFHHFAQLVDLDRKNPPVVSLIAELLDRIPESKVHRFHPVPKNILKSNQQRKSQHTPLGLLDHIAQIDMRASLLQWPCDNMPGFVDIEVLRAPILNTIE